MGHSSYGSGLGNVGAYSISGYPYMTGSSVDTNLANRGEVKVEFPRVAKGFTIANKGSIPLIFHYVSRANTDVITYHHYGTLNNQDDSWGMGARCIEIYVSALGTTGTGSFEIVAELTSVDRHQMHELTGSGINSPGRGF